MVWPKFVYTKILIFGVRGTRSCISLHGMGVLAISHGFSGLHRIKEYNHEEDLLVL